MDKHSSLPLDNDRLEALKSYQILDTLPEEEYDGITQLAAFICDVPVALISLVDENRQWFKAHTGLEVKETPIEMAFCAHAIHKPGETMIVEDARIDARFANNPLVKNDPNIVFYAGAPLIDPQGFGLGTLCVIDTKVRHLDEQQLKALELLRRQVVNLLVLRRTNLQLAASELSGLKDLQIQKDIRIALAESENRYKSLVENIPAVITRWDHRLQKIYSNAPSFDNGKGRTSQDLKGIRANLQEAAIATHPDASRIQSVLNTGIAEEYYSDFTTRTGNLNFLSRLAPEWSEEGSISSVINIAYDVTKLRESESRFKSLIEEAPVGTCLFVGKDYKVEVANEIMLNYWKKDRSILGHPLAEVLPELDGQPFLGILDNIRTTGKTYEAHDEPVDIITDGQLRRYYFDFTYKPLRDSSGEVYAILDMAVDVTERFLSRKAIEESEARFRLLIEEAPIATLVLTGPEFKLEIANEPMVKMLGKERVVFGKPYREIMPEFVNQGFIEQLKSVYTSGITIDRKSTRVEMMEKGKLVTHYFDYTYKPLKDIASKVYAVMCMALDVTEQVEGRTKLEESELFSRTIIDNSPIAKLVLTGEEMCITTINQKMLELAGSDDSILGMHLIEAIPELQKTSILENLKKVFKNGITFYQSEEKIALLKNGSLSESYYNYIFKPLHNVEGAIYGVIVTADDVTSQVTARQKVEAAEQSLLAAIELAELGTWQIDLKDNNVYYSKRLREWLGIPDSASLLFFEQVIDKDRYRIEEAIKHAINPEGNGIFDEVYTVENQSNGEQRILHSNGKTTFDSKGNPVTISGTAQDVTMQYELELALKNQVQIRTEQLAAAVKDLQSANEELEFTNLQLTNSNDELAQYAYVASHDLQEPLRKIRIFSEMLQTKPDTTAENHLLIGKICHSAKRMSLLINDLLDFSRLLKTDLLLQRVNLNEVISAVLDDFELTIQEKNAIVNVQNLPVIDGITLQMNQLFYNLISNALKFTDVGKVPSIDIKSEKMTEEATKKHFPKFARSGNFYHITITDNGIGFETQYSEQVFEVFKRLHGREVYPGSGIGLSLCRRIVSNLNGKLFAESRIGEGSIFHIFLPEQQPS